MKLVYWIEQPKDHPLHAIARKLGFLQSGWERPHYLNHGTGIINREAVEQSYAALDASIEPGLPLIINLEHFKWILRDHGKPISAHEWFERHRSIAVFMRQRWPNRLVGEWGLRIGAHLWLNDLYREDWTCGVLSIYRRAGATDKGWFKHVTRRYKKTRKANHPIQLDMSPIIYERTGAPRSEARPVTCIEWLRMLHVEKNLRPRWAGYWLRPDVLTDAEIEDTMRVMAKELG